MVDYDGRIGESFAHAIYGLHVGRIDEAAHRLPRLGSAAPHGRHSGTVKPFFFMNPRRDAKSRHLLFQQAPHRILRARLQIIDHADDFESARITSRGIDHIRVVVAVISMMLDEDNTIDARRSGDLEKFLGRETWRVQVVNGRSLGQREPLHIARPNVRMRIDVAGFRGSGGGGRIDGAIDKES